jgi:glycosyltransferase involved in cell wall biosynthesis
MNTLIKSLSVIIPVYNCEKYISRTLESIITSLDYFHAHYPLADQVKSEIIVANDCSTDNTTFFVSQFIGKKYPVKLVNHSINQGAGPARNTGFKNSQGEILFFCDGDDLFLPAHIYVCFMLLQGQYDEKTTFPLVQDNYQAQVNFLEQPVDAIKTKVKIEENIHPGWQQGIENSLPLNLCVRRSCHEFLEGFPEDPVYKKIGGAEDSAYYRYLCQFFKIAYVNLVTVEYIRYPGNSLDRQMPKFSQAPGAYQGILPHEKPELFAEARAIEQQRLEVLKAKYQHLNNVPDILSLPQEQVKTSSSQLKTIIITASDAKFFQLVKGTILSIRQKQPDQNIAIGFLDLGCQPEQLEWLKNQVNFITQPDWNFDFPRQNEAPTYLKGSFARPFLRQYFPDFDVYIWIDADAWIQKWDAIELFIAGAVKGKLTIVHELDRNYHMPYGDLPRYYQFVYNNYLNTFGEEVARKLHTYPMINSGVLGLHKDAPHWQVWETSLKKALQQNTNLMNGQLHIKYLLHMVDQMSLNFSVYEQELFKQTEILPVWCNWLTIYGLPLWDEEKSCFVEPYLPNVPIGIVHLAGLDKNKQVDLSTTKNNKISLNLFYPESSNNFSLKQYDYISTGLKLINIDKAFPHMIKGNIEKALGQYWRREIPHNWYVDDRHLFVGFLSRDEAHILYNTALKFTGKRALEIGCWMGWSACHLIAGGVNLDIVDPMLEKPEFQQSVINSLQATTRISGISTEVSINAGYSPQAVLNLASQHQRKWSLIFIDGNHDAPGPLNDAIACEPLAEDTAMVLFHDLASPDVAQGLDYFQQKGWKTMVYQTMQIMGVAWRGNIEPVEHQPDPQVNWVLPKHLAHHPVKFVE